MKEITSTSNQIIKQVKELKDKSSRYSLGQFVVEGANIIKDLPKSVDVLSLFVEKDKLSQFEDIVNKYDDSIVYLVDEKVMKALSDTQTPCGILCVVKLVTKPFEKEGNVVVLDGVSDPGNMGTIIRTCVACGVKTIFAINTVDYTSPKVVRSSMGGLFRVNLINSTYDEIFANLKDYNLVTLDMHGSDIFDNLDMPTPFALVVGNEAHGVSQLLKEKCNKLISLPMVGDIESLNAAVALSVALYQLTFRK